MKAKEKLIRHDHNHDGLDRRGFLECMAWAGTGMLWTVSGGLLLDLFENHLIGFALSNIIAKLRILDFPFPMG